MKKRAFTIVELLISISLLSITLIMSSLIFSNAIRQPGQLQNTILNSSKGDSKMEEKLNEIKKESARESNDVGQGVILKFEKLERRVKGHFVSYDKGKIKTGNQVKPTDELITFVGIGYKEPAVPKIKNLYFTNERFIYMPINADEKKLSAKYFLPSRSPVTSDTSTGSTMQENKEILKLLRFRFLQSNLKSRNFNTSHVPYSDNAYSFIENPSLNISEFGYIGGTTDKLELESEVNMTIPKYTADKQKYLDMIDRDYAAEGMTLNITGYTSPPFISFEDALDKSDAKNRNVHIIGLPYIGAEKELLAYFDHNLVMAKSKSSDAKEKGKYYSLYDIEKAKETKFENTVQKWGADKYSFNWNNNDSRNFIGTSSTKIDTSRIKIKEGFLNKKEYHKNIETSDTVDFPDVKKPYGNTVYYPLKESAYEPPFLNFKIPKYTKYTLFLKFNLHPESPDRKIAPVSILSYNMDNDGTIDDRWKYDGFTIYMDSDYKIYYYKRHYNGTTEYKEEHEKIADLSTTKLYSDGNFEFDKIGNTAENTSREGFNVLAISMEKRGGGTIDLQMHLLKKKEVLRAGKYELNTEIEKFFNETFRLTHEELTEFKLMSDMNTIDGTDLANKDEETNLELSDLLLYQGEGLDGYIYGEPNYTNLTMDYLYRKYLTERERHEGGFDQFFMTKY